MECGGGTWRVGMAYDIDYILVALRAVWNSRDVGKIVNNAGLLGRISVE